LGLIDTRGYEACVNHASGGVGRLDVMFNIRACPADIRVESIDGKAKRRLYVIDRDKVHSGE
jgi:hypothetical protein